MLPDLGPISRGHILESQRCSHHSLLRNMPPRSLALRALYRLGFSLGRGLRGAMKSMTSDLEIKLPERRARVTVDGHDGTSCRACDSINAATSASVNLLRGRRVPCPMQI